MWWNLIDCWPQVSASLVDYFFDRRLGFHYVRRSQRPICIMATEAQGWHRKVVLVNDSSWTGSVDYTISAVNDPSLRLSGRVESPASRDVELAQLPLAPAGECYLFRWSVDGVEYGNHYLEGTAPFSLRQYQDVYLPRIAELDTDVSLDDLWR